MLSVIVVMLIAFQMGNAAADTDAEFNTSLGSFSQRFFSELFKTNPSKNIIYSPFSIQSCLAMTRMGAAGNTAVEMDQGLGFTGQSPESVARNYHSLLAKYENGTMLKIANKVYVMENHELQDGFSESLVQNFNSKPENINFEKTGEAANLINAWVESKTNDKIKNVISPDTLGADTRLVLVSAIHFKGEWDEKFPEVYTSDREFYTDEKNFVMVPTMVSEGSFYYAELDDLDSTAVGMTYKDSDLLMLIILPNSRTGLGALEEKLRSLPLTTLKSKFAKKRNKIEIFLPKFQAEFQIELKEPLKNVSI